MLKNIPNVIPTAEQVAAANPAVDAELLAGLRILQDGLPQSARTYSIEQAFDTRTVMGGPQRLPNVCRSVVLTDDE